MHTDAITNGDRQHTQVSPDPLDYVLRYTAGDYDCYYQGRYIGSRATLPKAIEAIEYEQAKAARHPQLLPAADSSIDVESDELRAITAASTDSAISVPALGCLHRARRRARILEVAKHHSGECLCAVQIR